MKLSQLRVLICDDNRAHRRMVKQLVLDMGVNEAADGPAMFGYSAPIATFNPDMVIGRLTQDERGIIELINWLRNPELTPLPGIPILLSVGTASRELLTLAVKTGADLLVAEPLTIGALEMRISALMKAPPPRVAAKNYFGPDRRRTPQSAYFGSERRQRTPSAAHAASSALSKVSA